MNDLQQAKFRMFQAVLGVFANHIDAYQKVPALVKSHDVLSILAGKLDPTAEGQQKGDSEPVSAVKQKTKSALALQANDLAAPPRLRRRDRQRRPPYGIRLHRAYPLP
jgi:hypothetical protein